MQTFLPYASFEHTASVLDYRRLGKQRVEARQIIHTIVEHRHAWATHPAVRMWRGHVDALRHYFNVISREWVARGYQHNMGFYDFNPAMKMPEWVGREDVHSSHRAALLFKDPNHYSQFGWTETPEVNYIWPRR